MAGQTTTDLEVGAAVSERNEFVLLLTPKNESGEKKLNSIREWVLAHYPKIKFLHLKARNEEIESLMLVLCP